MGTQHFVLHLKIDRVTVRTSSPPRRASSETPSERKAVAEMTSVTLRGASMSDILLKAERLIQLERDLSGEDVKGYAQEERDDDEEELD